ncbi:LacI family gluconate utilization system Gnt-I transcriptional repressor [Microvirga lupini]|uniref:LacI family gluconate utilization system Gnt-I transcriptional repressor n=1 Tax=Microvirga lupini TaxID=420324 RepID=A0A7W4VMN6_9HYPH|nr:LacI family DNA-binding transcriptional regulator [Microvirga lupini]MBB3019666.1 LacI family gluconate utilization system Gnt-I transcriptional repressor [Microvirga lupini]
MDVGSSLQNRVPRKRRKMQRVTMMDVAKLAQVSPSTVSLYLRKPAAVSPAAGQEIARAISTLGYVPNLVAGGLAAASSKVVSIIVPSIRNAFFAETVSTLQSELAAEGLQVILGHSEYGEEQEEALVRTALAWAPAAVVLTGLSHSAETRKLLQASGVPVVEMWEIGGNPIDMAVGFSHPQVGASAARHLLSKGRRSLAFLGARMQEDHRAAKRANGFAEEAKRTGHATCEVINHPGAATVEAGSLLLNRALQQVPNLDAIACSNDLIALGALFECQRQGLAVPDKIAVAGFGDLDFSASCIPSLTTIRPSGDLIGKEVARLILAGIHGAQPTGPSRIIDTGHVLVERRST